MDIQSQYDVPPPMSIVGLLLHTPKNAPFSFHTRSAYGLSVSSGGAGGGYGVASYGYGYGGSVQHAASPKVREVTCGENIKYVSSYAMSPKKKQNVIQNEIKWWSEIIE